MASASQSGDRLLVLAAGALVLMGLAWLVIEAPWSDAESSAAGPVAAETPIVPAEADAAAGRATVGVQAQGQAQTNGTTDALRMAQMALDAGMLMEPADYSAWSLFGRIADEEPDNDAARTGLEQVAELLLQRGESALEQGRYDDADGIVATIATRLPNHAGADSLKAAIAEATAPPPEPVVSARPQAVAEEIDPIPELNDALREALIANNVLRPEGASAIDVVSEMRELAPEHELTIAASDLLVTEMLDRSRQSIEALDSNAARTWIDSAERLAPDPERIAGARDQLARHLIEMESQRILPAAQARAIATDPPEFPRIPLERGIEGWVQVEFFITPEGATEAPQVVDASHDRYFREEAMEAVAAWRFEPVMFMGQPIRKRSIARLEFVLD